MISIRAFKHFALAMGIGLATIWATSFAPTEAVAQDTDKISMQFVGFGANPDFYAILQSSKLGGKALVIYQIGGQGPKLVYPLNKTSLEAALQSKEVAVFGRPSRIQTRRHGHRRNTTTHALGRRAIDDFRLCPDLLKPNENESRRYEHYQRLLDTR